MPGGGGGCCDLAARVVETGCGGGCRAGRHCWVLVVRVGETMYRCRVWALGGDRVL